MVWFRSMNEEVIPDCNFYRMLLQSLPLLLFPRFLAFLAYSGPQRARRDPHSVGMTYGGQLCIIAIGYCNVCHISGIIHLVLPTLLFTLAQTPCPSPLGDRPTTTVATGHPMLVPFTIICIAGIEIQPGGWAEVKVIHHINKNLA